MSFDSNFENIRDHLRENMKLILELKSTESIIDAINSSYELEISKHLKLMFKVLQNVNNWPIESMPIRSVEVLNNRIKETLDQIKKYFDHDSLTNYGTNAYNNEMLDRERVLFDRISALINFIIPLDSYYNREAYSFENIERLKSRYDEMFEGMLNKYNESDLLLKAQQNAARDTAISTHSIHFHKTSKNHMFIAVAWLIAAIGIAISTIVFRESLFFLNQDFKSNIETTYYILKGLSKFLFISIIFLFLYTCLRQFRAHIHNSVVNHHRTMALQTFQALVKATDDIETKNVVLLKVTEAIFAPVTTGFLTKETESKGSSQLIEIFQSALKGGK